MRCRWDHYFHPRVGSLNASSLVFYRATSATFYVAFVVVVVDVAAADAAATFRKTHGRPSLFSPFQQQTIKPKISILTKLRRIRSRYLDTTSNFGEWMNKWMNLTQQSRRFAQVPKHQGLRCLLLIGSSSPDDHSGRFDCSTMQYR